jgi:PTH1 family peptidyl-tRNA hydrolase
VRLLVGLGNPGPKYERTRHNVGFRVAEEAARSCGVALDQGKFGAVLGVGRSHGEQLAVLLPQTFMNVSGESVGPAARFWKIDAGTVVVAHDDMDLEFGRVQVKVGGGDGGHNGLKSVRAHLGTPDFVRVRVGVGRPPQGWDPADYVLSKFTGAEESELPKIIEDAAGAALDAATQGALAAMNKWNRRKQKAAVN